MVNTATVVPEEQYFILSSLPPTRAQTRLALAVVLTLLVAYFITERLLSTIQLGQVGAFIPAYATAMFVNDSITAVRAAKHPAFRAWPAACPGWQGCCGCERRSRYGWH